jgi:hypothetical protein
VITHPQEYFQLRVLDFGDDGQKPKLNKSGFFFNKIELKTLKSIIKVD